MPIIEVIFIRQPHGAVFGVQLPQQLYHGTPVAQHPGARALVGGNAGADLIPRNAAVIADYWDVFHGKEPRGEILGQQYAARHLFQRLYEQFPLIHEPRAADAVIIEQQIAADGPCIVVRRVVGGAVKGGLARDQVRVAARRKVGLPAEGHARRICLQAAKPPAQCFTVIEEISRRKGQHPPGGDCTQGVLHVFHSATVRHQLDGLHIGDAVGCKICAALGKIILR